MLRTRALASLGMVLAGAVFWPAPTLPADNPASAAAAVHRATFDQYCFSCHSSPTPRAGVNLRASTSPISRTTASSGRSCCASCATARCRRPACRGPTRPPTKRSSTISRPDATVWRRSKPNPGRPTLHRLNRTEYANAIRDLLAIEIDVAELLPADDIGYGFDNIGDVLNVSPLLLERYLVGGRQDQPAGRGRYHAAAVLSDL